MLGAISLSNSNHFALMPYSATLKPVTLLPGCAKLSTNMAPTGSVTATNTIGTERVACCNAKTLGLALARITSGASATNSAAYVEILLASAQRYSIRKLRPLDQPIVCSACSSAAWRRRFRIIFREGLKHADTPHPVGQLRARRERPRRRAPRAA